MCKTCTTFSARPSLQNDMDGGVAAALIEEEAEQRACPDLDAHWRLDEALETIQRLTQERYEARKFATAEHVRATEAERERDEARDDAARPLTPSAIESVLHDILPLTTERLGADDIAGIAFDLHAALTEPARPEGAEELARLIRDADVGEWDCGDLADAILATGRVRVVTEEQQ